MNHSASVIEILSVEAQEGKSDKGKPYTLFTCPSIIHCNTGETKVGNIKMAKHGNNEATFKTPVPGKYHPVYEPRPNWKSGECMPELVELIPVSAVVRPAVPQSKAA